MLLMQNFSIKLGRCHYPIVRKIFWPIRRQLFLVRVLVWPQKNYYCTSSSSSSSCSYWISSQYYSSKCINLLKMADDQEWRQRDSTVFFLFPDDARYVGTFYHEEFDYISGFGLFQLTWVPRRRLKIATNTWDIQWLPLFGMADRQCTFKLPILFPLRW